MTRSMSSPLVGLDDARPAETGLESVELEPFTDFELCPDGRMRCAGYTPAEVAELLGLYREHMRLLGEQAIAMNAALHG
jgi:hypothetical protein